MKFSIVYIAIFMAVMLLSCGKRNSSDSSEMVTQEVSMADLANSEEYGVSSDSAVVVNKNKMGAPVLQNGNQGSVIDWDKKIIKTGNVTVEPGDYKKYNSDVHTSIQRFGAYISGEQQSETDIKIENTITIKVPVGQFENMMNFLQPKDAKVLVKQISTEDVTGEMVDTKARIEARKQVRDQYLLLLKQAKNMKEILEVQKEINAIQEDIEAGTGRVEFLSHQASFSTIHLTFFQYLNGNNNIDDPSPSFLVKLKEAFKDGSSIITGLVLILVTFWPILAAAFVLWWILKKQPFKQMNLVKKVE